MGIDNVIAGDGLGLAVTGMVVVFLGLLLTSAYIALLPRFFDWLDGARARWKARTAATGRAPRPGRPSGSARDSGAAGELAGLGPELRAAIGYVLDAERERERSQDRQRITMREDGEQRVWTAIGKMRTLSTRL